MLNEIGINESIITETKFVFWGLALISITKTP